MKKTSVFTAVIALLILLTAGAAFIKTNNIHLFSDKSDETVVYTFGNKDEDYEPDSSEDITNTQSYETGTHAGTSGSSDTEASSAAAKSTESSSNNNRSSASASRKSNSSDSTATVRVTTTTNRQRTTKSSVVNNNSVSNIRFYYNRLSNSQKYVYAVALDALSSGKLEFDIPASYKESLKSGLYAFIFDYPEYCNLRTGYTFYTRGNTTHVELETFSFYTGADGGKYKSSAESKAKSIAQSAKTYSNPYEQIKYVHDWLCSNVTYDTSAARKSDSSKTVTEQLSASAYGALNNGKAICSGYSYAFIMIMHELGYECGMVSGVADGESHGWNVIKIGSDYYYIDVTWDDADQGDLITYYYFLLTSSEINKDHQPSNDYSLPDATATQYNYYYYNGYILDSYDYYAAKEILDKQYGNKYYHIKFTNQSDYQAAVNDKQLSNYAMRLKGKMTIRYYYNEDCNVIIYT